MFGSRGQGLKDALFGNNSRLPLASNEKGSSTIKIVKKDDNYVRIVSILLLFAVKNFS